MRTNGYLRSKERKHRLEKLFKQKAWLVYRERWDDPKSRLVRSYLSGKRGYAKERTSEKVRHAEDIPNYSGYRRFFGYDTWIW